MQDIFLDQRWPALLTALPADLDLDATARTSGALRRRRAIGDAAALLRLALGYSPGGLSLRGAAAWAELSGLASLSDVAVLKRLRGAGDWLSHIAGALLAARVEADVAAPPHRIRLIDATTICAPSTKRIMWRLHASYDPARPGFDDLQLTDQSRGEHRDRFAIAPGDLAIGDARGRGFTGGGEVARYIGRHGTGRIAKLHRASIRQPLPTSAAKASSPVFRCSRSSTHTCLT